MNFQKPHTRAFKTDMTYHPKTNAQQTESGRTTMNFLNKTYQRTNPDFYVQNRSYRDHYDNEVLKPLPNVNVNMTNRK